MFTYLKMNLNKFIRREWLTAGKLQYGPFVECVAQPSEEKEKKV